MIWKLVHVLVREVSGLLRKIKYTHHMASKLIGVNIGKLSTT